MKLKLSYFHLLILLTLAISLGISKLASQELEQQRTLVIVGDSDYAPYEFLDQNKKASGLATEISQLIAANIGRVPAIKLTKWSQAKKSLDSGDADAVQGMALTSKRAKEYYFSMPYAQVSFNIFTPKHSKIKTLKDISTATLVMQQDDVSNEFLELIGFKGKVIEVQTQIEALRFLNKGIYDATILNHTHGKYLVEKYHFSNVKALKERILPQDYCFASKDLELIHSINEALMHISYTGELQKIQDKWLAPYEPKWEVANLFAAKHIRPTLIVLLLFVSMGAFILWYHFRKRKAQKLMNEKMAKKLTELADLRFSFGLFAKTPIILYKVQINPLKLLYVSPNISKYGYSYLQLIEPSFSFLELIHPEDIQDVLNYLKDKQRGVSKDPKEFRIKDVQGQYHWMLNYSYYDFEKPQNNLIYGMFVQNNRSKILEEKLLEANLKTADATIAKGQFLATISHEIRTPINGILSLLEALRMMPMTSGQKELYDLIDASGKSLNELIKDILDFSKMDSGQISLQPGSFNLKYMISSIIDFYAAQRHNSMVDLRLEYDEELPQTLWGDHVRTRQIINNLLQNALKFTMAGWVKLSVSLYIQAAESCHVLFCVKDTGVGIKTELLDHVFDIFYQANQTMPTFNGGSGLGLAIVKRLTILMDGILWVESEPDKGSSFYVLIPYGLKEPVKEAEEEESATIDKLLFPLDVLIIEHDPILRKQLANTLESWGLYPKSIDSFEQIPALCAETSFDFILLDEQENTDALIQMIRKIKNQEHPAVVQIVLQAENEKHKEAFMACGVDSFSSKPTNLRELKQTLSIIAQNKKNIIKAKSHE